MSEHRLTQNQLIALKSIRGGEWKFGVWIDGRYSLPSLYKLGLVNVARGKNVVLWQITLNGEKVLNEYEPASETAE